MPNDWTEQPTMSFPISSWVQVTRSTTELSWLCKVYYARLIYESKRDELPGLRQKESVLGKINAQWPD